jgi:hypothetical protein
VAALLADCVIEPRANGPHFVTLGRTPDFEDFSYLPHCRLFFMISAALILQDDLPPDWPHRNALAISTVPRPLLDAWFLKSWIKTIGPMGQALAKGRRDDLHADLVAILRAFIDECAGLEASVPKWVDQQVNFHACGKEWVTGGFPAALGQPLTANVKRINDLPMTDFVADLIKKALVDLQTQAFRDAG